MLKALINNYTIRQFSLQWLSLHSNILPSLLPDLLGLVSSEIQQVCMFFPLKDLGGRGKQVGSCARRACNGAGSYLHEGFN